MVKKIIFFILLFTCTAYAQFPPPVEFTEEDASPSTYPYKVKYPNNAVTDNGDGTVSIRSIISSDNPTNPSDTCVSGQNAFDASYYYICISTNTWKRVAIATWAALNLTADDGVTVITADDGSTILLGQ